VEKIIRLKNELNTNEAGRISGVELNLTQRSSNISNKLKWSFITGLRDCSDVFFKSKELSFVRIGKKK